MSGSELRKLESAVDDLKVKEGRDTADTEPGSPVLSLKSQGCSFQELKNGLIGLQTATATGQGRWDCNSTYYDTRDWVDVG